MKTILIIAIALFGLSMTTGCMSYQAVNTTPYTSVYEDMNGSQDELFLKANDWMVSTFKDAESVIQYSDKEEGVIIGKYLLHQGAINPYHDTRVYAKIDVRVKDGRSKIEISPIGEWIYDPSGMTIYNYSPEDAKADMIRISNMFYKHINETNIDW